MQSDVYDLSAKETHSMTTIRLNDVKVSSDNSSRSEGWLTIQLHTGERLKAYCPETQDNWAQGTKRVCHHSAVNDAQTLNLATLLLQETHDGQYIILQAELSRPAIPMTYARPANEHVFLELPHKQKSVFSVDFLALVAIIFVALYGLKWVLEKYLLPKL